MPVVDPATLPEIAMREGITGKWIASRERGAGGVGVLANTVQPGAGAPLHRHEHEEVILVEAGRIWVEMGGPRLEATPGQCVIIPAGTPHAWGNDGPEPLRVLFVWNSPDPFAPGRSTYLEGAPPAVA
ncbi:cupin domain-containing protein [Reyranella sp.]|uniref:cupin domain-containing protein n=1 Tax=Reyranella sp. TaxID=1929291 RepID=UPI003BAC3CF3